MNQYDIIIEQEYPNPPERVWRALADSASLADWLMPNDFLPKLGHKFQFRSKPMPGWRGFVDCEVIELDEPRCLAYTWAGDDDVDQKTVVRWTLIPTAGGTLLRMEHTGFVDPWGKPSSDAMRGGWGKMLRDKLPKVIAGLSPSGSAPPA